MDETMLETHIIIEGGVHQQVEYYGMLNDYYIADHCFSGERLSIAKRREDACFLKPKDIKNIKANFPYVKIIKVIVTVEENESTDDELIF